MYNNFCDFSYIFSISFTRGLQFDLLKVVYRRLPGPSFKQCISTQSPTCVGTLFSFFLKELPSWMATASLRIRGPALPFTGEETKARDR